MLSFAFVHFVFGVLVLFLAGIGSYFVSGVLGWLVLFRGDRDGSAREFWENLKTGEGDALYMVYHWPHLLPLAYELRVRTLLG